MDSVLSTYRAAANGLVAPGGPFALSQPGGARTRRLAGTKQSLLDIFDAALAQHGCRPMFEFENERRTYAQVFADAHQLAASLAARYRIAPGERVGLAMRNRPEWFPAFFAIHKLGAVAVLLNSRGSGSELAETAADVGCRLVLADERCALRLHGKTHIPVLDLAAAEVLAQQPSNDFRETRATGDDPALILFTSGTTGRPKGATLTHANLVCATRQLEYVGELGLELASGKAGMPVEALRERIPKPTPLLVVPLYHISGIVSVIVASCGGGMLVGMRRWDAVQALELIERNQVTQITGPSLVVDDLLALPGAPMRMASVKTVVVAGQASPVAMSQRVRAALPQASQSAGWGMTELTGSAASAAGAVFDAHADTVGFVLPLLDIELRDNEGKPVSQGAVGEIYVRGPVVMDRYWNRPQETAQAFDGDWFGTGDLGRINEHGLLSIVDRAKDMVISAGENIYCAEVERVLSMLGHHAEVALFGVPDERMGERAVAAIVFAEGCDIAPDGEAVCDHVRLHLADYKVPGEVAFDLGPLPRNALGKVDKMALRKRYQARSNALHSAAL